MASTVATVAPSRPDTGKPPVSGIDVAVRDGAVGSVDVLEVLDATADAGELAELLIHAPFRTESTDIVPAGDEACGYEYSYEDLFTERLRAAGQSVTHLQTPLPPEYVSMSPADLDARIASARSLASG